mmetsp:Transcript_16235/g.31434  ORF Transcript_16235/g.31434 Transcript_16235/m.31434 type:complete len:663 (-) Transcript_16235:541-2529(-)
MIKSLRKAGCGIDSALKWMFSQTELVDEIMTLGLGPHIDRLLGLRPEVENPLVFNEKKMQILELGNELHIWTIICTMLVWMPEMAYVWNMPLWTLYFVFTIGLLQQYALVMLARRYPLALRFYFGAPDILLTISAWQTIYVDNTGWSLSSFYALVCWHRIITCCLLKESFSSGMVHLLLICYFWATDTALSSEDLMSMTATSLIYSTAAVLLLSLLIFSTIRAKILYCELAAAEAAKVDHLRTVFHFVSHEYRNHFFAGTLALDSLHSNQALSMNAQRDIEVLDRAHRNISALMENVLQMSRLDTSERNIWQGEAAPFSLSGDLVKMIRNYGEAVSGVRFGHKPGLPATMWGASDHVHFQLEESETAKTLPAVFGCASLLFQAANNLVSNAIKFTPPGGLVTVFVDADPFAAPGKARISIKVSDTGRGISEECKSRIFEPFVQSNVRDSLDLGGSGLGLSFTKKIVEAYEGGRISLDSQVNVGSTFEISLLLPFHVHPDSYSSLLNNDSENLTLKQQEVVSVLIVDDSMVNRLMLQNYITRKLLQEGLRIEISDASDGPSAVAVVARNGVNAFHAITMDFHMPGEFNGVEATRRIRALGFKGHIIGVTGEEDPDQMQLMLDGGCDAVWRKGGSLEQLLRELKLHSTEARERLLRRLPFSSTH